MVGIDWELTWATVQAVSAAVATGVIIITAWYAKGQLSEAAHLRYAQVLERIGAILGDHKVVAARQAVMQLPDNFDIDSLAEDQREQIETVTRSFDRAGFYLWCKLIPEKYVLSQYPGAIWHWRKLERYIRRQREIERHEARKFFEHMAVQTEKFRTKHNLPV